MRAVCWHGKGDIRVEKAPKAPDGYFETILSLRSKTPSDVPLQVRAFGEIAQPHSE